MPKPFRPLDFVAPRHWPVWLALGLLRAGVALPYRWQLRLGAGLGRLLWWALPSRRRVARTNLRLAFPQLGEREREALAQASFRSAGISVFESGLSWWAPTARLAALGRVTGLEHLERALARGKGVILLTGHMSAFELGGRILSLCQPFQVMYKRQRSPLFEAFSTEIRQRHYLRAVQRHDVRGMIRGLRDNLVCWYAPDQDFGRRNSVFAPFFGVPTATVTATSRFAAMTGAAVVPFFPYRRADGSGYDIQVLPPLDDFPSGDDTRDAERLNAVIEAAARKAPEQYLWLHRRFRTRPRGEKNPYA